MTAVFEFVKQLLCARYACEEELVEMAATLDDLNLAPYERTELAVILSDRYGVPISDKQAQEFETVEDVVAYIEDRLYS